jgi:K(+)-stimulated pyrophosphate-energized sodium pump
LKILKKNNMSQNYFSLIIALISVLFSFWLIRKIKKSPSGSGKMIEISQAIRNGAVAFLKREYQTIAIVALILAILLGLLLGKSTAIGFLVGAVASALSGYIGMMISTQTNVKVSEAARSGLEKAFNLSVKGGAVTGFLVVGLGLLSVSGIYLFFHDLKSLIALGFGGSLISIFARLGGGIYTKAADVGADLVGKVEKGIPEDDPRNPAVIADQVGDNVGDCAGMAADLFETYVSTLGAAVVLGKLIFPHSIEAIFFPLNLAAISILASIVATFFIKLGKNKAIIPALYRGLIVAGILSAVLFYPMVLKASKDFGLKPLNLYLSAIIGLLIVAGIFYFTEFFTSKKYPPVKSIAQASQSGHGTNIITGLAVGYRSTIFPVLLISLGTLFSFWLTGIYGLAIAVVSMLSLTGLIITLDSYGPITDNAAGIAEMSEFPKEVREITDSLDAVGNTTKAVTKGYAIGSAGLAALVLFSAYQHELLNLGQKIQFFLEDPKVLAGLFIGGVISYYFVALAMEAVGKTASKVVEEVRRQFKEIPGLMEGRAKPDYGKCVDIVTKAALAQMVLPSLLPVLSPILVGWILGAEALGGLLIGSIVVGIFLAISMTSGGAAWDNAKKYIEEGNFGGKGSFAHQTAVTGDTVGDAFKDTAGPAINPMIKVINIIALLIASFLV